MRKQICVLLAISALLLGYPTPSLAGGSLPLIWILQPLINQSKKLTKEVEREMKNNRRNADDTVCTGRRIGSRLSLSGKRFAPFECRFENTKKVLKIEAINYLRFSNGKMVPLEKLPDMSPQPENVSLVMKLKSWRWEQLKEE